MRGTKAEATRYNSKWEAEQARDIIYRILSNHNHKSVPPPLPTRVWHHLEIEKVGK